MNTLFVFVFVLCSSSIWASTSDLGAAESDCLADAIATADPNNAVGEAISNAIAQAFTTAITCGDSNQHNDGGFSSLAVSVAVAIASSETAGKECLATSDAVAEVVSDIVTEGVAGGLLENTDSTELTLAEAWLAEESESISDKIQQVASARQKTGTCSNLGGLQQSLTTASEVGDAMEDAISQILRAVNCGDNFEEDDPEGLVATPSESAGFEDGVIDDDKDVVGEEDVADCRYDAEMRRFYGTCKPAKKREPGCNAEFRSCRSAGTESRRCHARLQSCSRDKLNVAKAKNPRRRQKERGGASQVDGKGGSRGSGGSQKSKGGKGGKGGASNRSRDNGRGRRLRLSLL